jgi:hypothetical protein
MGDAPMTYDIRPLSFGEILDRAFRVYLDHFWLLFGIAATFWIPFGILRTCAATFGRGAEASLGLLLMLTAEPIMRAALVFAIASEYLDRPVSIGEAYRSVRAILLTFVTIRFLYALLLVFAIVTIAGGYALIFVAQLGAAASLAVILLVPFGAELYFLICWCLLWSVIVIERLTGISAMRRSRQLVIDAWWQTFGILIVALLITAIPSRTLKFFWGFIPVVGAILTHVTYATANTYAAVVIVVYYFDRRCRLEDFDLRLLAEQVRAQSPRTIETASEASAPA